MKLRKLNKRIAILLTLILLISFTNSKAQRIIGVNPTGKYANYIFNYYGAVTPVKTQQLKSVFKYIHKVKHKRPKRLFIVLNSGGGSVMAAREQIRMIEHYKQKGVRVETVVFDHCHSACVNLYLMGTKRHVLKNSKMIIHQARAGVSGLMLPSLLKGLKRVSKEMITFQCMRLKFDDKRCAAHWERTKSNLELYPADMVHMGISHYIIEDYRDLLYKED